jgi:hypothetical protein
MKIDAVPKESGCMRFRPHPTGSTNCECSHSLYSHYMCGSPEESKCLVCKAPTLHSESMAKVGSFCET